MQSVDERVRELDKEVAVMREILERSMTTDEDFKKEVRNKLNDIHERNSKVDAFIESEMNVRKDRADFWKGLRDKLATSGVLGALSLLGYVVWYGVVHFIQNGGK